MNSLYFKTKRLEIRPITTKNEEQLYSVLNNKEISQMMPMIPHPYPREKIKWFIDFMDKRTKDKISFELGLFLKEEGDRYIGSVMINIDDVDKESCLIGYFIDPRYWRRGYATEGMDALLKFAIDELKLTKIIGRCKKENGGSRRVLEKLGFVYTDTVKQNIVGKELCIRYYRYPLPQSSVK